MIGMRNTVLFAQYSCTILTCSFGCYQFAIQVPAACSGAGGTLVRGYYQNGGRKITGAGISLLPLLVCFNQINYL